jgi:hypothetical protein
MLVADAARSPIESIPPPDLIRDRLARIFAEARLLRRLLRLSESKARGLRGHPAPNPRGEEVGLAH